MSNEVRPYPGFSAMLEEFQELFADWAVAGYPSADFVLPGGKHHQKEDRRIYDYPLYLSTSGSNFVLSARYAKESGFIFYSSTIDSSAVSAIATFCKRNNLKHDIHYSRPGESFPDHLVISGTPQNFLSSELNGKLVRSRERARSLAPLAQRFYNSEIIEKIKLVHPKPIGWYRFETSAYGIRYYNPNRYGEDPTSMFIFNEQGYRNLQSEDEQIAFTLALFAHEWGIEPIRLDWDKLLWNIKTPLNAPRYDVYCPYTDPPRKPQPASKPTYKDFF